MSSFVTQPGRAFEAITEPEPSVAALETLGTGVMNFEAIRNLLSNAPLRNSVTSLAHQLEDDESDLAAIAAARKSGKPRPYRELRANLGLKD